MSVNVLYTTAARAVGGRDGRAGTLDGSLDVKLATPRELGGAGGEGTNPEQLFAAGYAACFLNAIKYVANSEKTRISPESTVTSTVGIGPNDAGGFGLTVALEITLPGIEREQAEALVQKAHQACPYSNAVRGNIDVHLSIL